LRPRASAGTASRLFQYSSNVADSWRTIGPAAKTSSSANWDCRIHLKVLITDVAPADERYRVVDDQQLMLT